jgi:hypothetical protein
MLIKDGKRLTSTDPLKDIRMATDGDYATRSQEVIIEDRRNDDYFSSTVTPGNDPTTNAAYETWKTLSHFQVGKLSGMEVNCDGDSINEFQLYGERWLDQGERKYSYSCLDGSGTSDGETTLNYTGFTDLRITNGDFTHDVDCHGHPITSFALDSVGLDAIADNTQYFHTDDLRDISKGRYKYRCSKKKLASAWAKQCQKLETPRVQVNGKELDIILTSQKVDESPPPVPCYKEPYSCRNASEDIHARSDERKRLKAEGVELRKLGDKHALYLKNAGKLKCGAGESLTQFKFNHKKQDRPPSVPLATWQDPSEVWYDYTCCPDGKDASSGGNTFVKQIGNHIENLQDSTWETIGGKTTTIDDLKTAMQNEREARTARQVHIDAKIAHDEQSRRFAGVHIQDGDKYREKVEMIDWKIQQADDAVKREGARVKRTVSERDEAEGLAPPPPSSPQSVPKDFRKACANTISKISNGYQYWEGWEDDVRQGKALGDHRLIWNEDATRTGKYDNDSDYQHYSRRYLGAEWFAGKVAGDDGGCREKWWTDEEFAELRKKYDWPPPCSNYATGTESRWMCKSGDDIFPLSLAGGGVSTNGKCGPNNNETICPGSQCCSDEGWCGGTKGDGTYPTSGPWCAYETNYTQYKYGDARGTAGGIYDGTSPPPPKPPTRVVSTNGKCGPMNNETVCPGKQYCALSGPVSGQDGKCGTATMAPTWKSGYWGGAYDGKSPPAP